MERWVRTGAASFIGICMLLAMSACGTAGNGGKTATAPAAAAATSPTARAITIEGAWARNAAMPATPEAGIATPAMDSMPSMGATASASIADGPPSAAYMVIKNTGTVDDALIGAETGVATAAEVHETVMTGDTATMRPAPRVELKAGATLELKPGSYHVMLIGLKQSLQAGSTFTLTLKFEKAGAVPVTLDVRAE